MTQTPGTTQPPNTTQTPLPSDIKSIILSIKNENHTIKELENLPKVKQVELLNDLLDSQENEPSRTPSTYGLEPKANPENGTYSYTQDFHPHPKHILNTIEDKIKFKLLELCGGVLTIRPSNQNNIFTNCFVFSTGHWVSIQYFKPETKITPDQYSIIGNQITFIE